MGGIKDYLKRQENIISKANARMRMADSIRLNLSETHTFDDTHLKIHSSNDRNGYNQILGKCSDSVYRKLFQMDKHAELSARGKYWGYGGIIRGMLNDRLIDIERRTMTEETYSHLNSSSAETLLDEWVEQIKTERKAAA